MLLASSGAQQNTYVTLSTVGGQIRWRYLKAPFEVTVHVKGKISAPKADPEDSISLYVEGELWPYGVEERRAIFVSETGSDDRDIDKTITVRFPYPIFDEIAPQLFLSIDATVSTGSRGAHPRIYNPSVTMEVTITFSTGFLLSAGPLNPADRAVEVPADGAATWGQVLIFDISRGEVCIGALGWQWSQALLS